MIQNNKNNINAGIVNIGSGTVNAEGSVNTVGTGIETTDEWKAELQRIINQIDSILAKSQTNDDYHEVSSEIKNELQKQEPSKKFLKRCFQAIPTIIEGVIANEITDLLNAAIALLSSI